MKLAIVGSRNFKSFRKMYLSIQKLMEVSDIELIVSGGAKGADTLAEHFADMYNIPKKIFKPDWNTFGKRAGFLRNKDIVDTADQVIAFWDGKSKGTKSTIDLAKEQNKLLKIINI